MSPSSPGKSASGADYPLSGPVYLPLSGAVTQAFAPWVNITVNVGQSSNPAVEKDALTVWSYGRQLGRITDALVVLLRHFEPKRDLDPAEKQAIADLRSMVNEIANVKDTHRAKPALRL